MQTTGASTTATTSYSYSWDTTAKSSTVETTDAAANIAYTEYNAMGQPWRTWGSAAQPSLNTYDSYGRLTNLRTWQSGSFTGTTWPSPAGGNLVTWNLDAATGAVMSKVYPNSSTVSFTYNARGQAKTRTWARGVVTTYDYWEGGGGNDLTGELRQVAYSDGTPAYSIARSRVGAPWGITDAAGNRVLNYRSDLQLDYEALSAFYGSRNLTASYDGYGRSTGYSFNGSATVSATIGYDAATSRPNSVAGALGGTSATFSLGYATGTDWVNSVTSGSYTRSTPLVSKYDVLASATTTWSGTQLGNFTANYTDARGWRNGQKSGSPSGTPAGSWSKVLNLGDGLQSSYSYNGYGELTSAPTPTWQNASGSQSLSARNFGWTYDLAGNRATETGAAPTTYTPDALNRYTSITGTLAEPGLSHDADGNLTQDGTWTYAYDGENRLKSMTKSGQSLTFVYDYIGRRIRKTVTGTGASDTKFLWVGWKLAAELAADGVTANKTFIWGRDFSDVQGAAGGAGSLLAQITASTVTYAMPDALGNMIGYVNTSGTIVAAAEYSPYGRMINSYGSVSSYPMGYSGQYTDSETGLVYYGYRYYNPKHGRFINRDPIEEAGGNNLYRFVGNGPTRGWDVLGQNQRYDATGRPIEPRWVETVRRQYSSQSNFGIFGYGSALSNLIGGDGYWVEAYSHSMDFNLVLDGLGIPTEWQSRRSTDEQGNPITVWGYGTSDGRKFSPSRTRTTESTPGSVPAERIEYGELIVLGVVEAPNSLLGGRPEIVTEDMLIGSPGPDGSVFGTDPWTGKTVILKAAPGMSDGTLDVASLVVMPPFIKQAFAAVAGVFVRFHHPYPKYLGGEVQQILEPLPKTVHDAFHSGLDKILPRQAGTAYYESLSSAARTQTLQDLGAYAKAFDAKYGTQLYDAMIREGFPH